MNLIRAVVGLIPGGAAILQHLQQSGALQRAFEWATGELERLGLTWTRIRGAVSTFIDSLGPGDLVNLGGVFDRARRLFGPLLAGAVRFASAAGRKLLEFVFEAVMAAAGGQRILGVFRRLGETFQLIVSDPVRFIGNLVNAVKGGFQRFAANIIGHLRTALFEWLLGALRGALTLPSRWDLAGIVSVVLQVLGLTYQALRQRLVRLIGERAVGYIETAFEWIRLIATRGLAAAWDKIVEFASGLVDTVVEGIRNWVARSIVGAAITRLVTMFNPVGALIQSILAIYNTIMFFVERAQQIAALLESIIDSISSIARGSLGAAIGFVERTMARVLPVLISFLARLIGLGNISGTIREIIGRIRGVVDRAIDRVVAWVVARVRGLIARMSGPGRAAEQPATGDVRDLAGSLVAQRIQSEKTDREMDDIVAGVRRELAPQGLRRLEFARTPENGEYPLIAQASAPKTVGKKTKRAPDRTATVVMTARLVFDRPALTALGRGERPPEAFREFVVPRPRGVPRAEYEGPTGLQQAEPLGPPPTGQPRAGVVALRPPSAAAEQIRVVAWNSGDPARGTNTSHAEHFFLDALPAYLPGLKEIHVQINLSPCSDCARELRGFKQRYPDLVASLRHRTVYDRRDEFGILKDNATTTDDLAAMRGRGWAVDGPDPRWTDASKRLEIQAGKSLYVQLR
jgi:hypothetical protein